MGFGPAVNIAPGTTLPSALRTAPSGWLLCDGSAVSRTTYANLFNAVCNSLGTITVTIASPAVVSLTSHGLSLGDQVRFTTTGALPTGIVAGTDYYVSTLATNTFQIATLPSGSSINSSGSQSGTHTGWYAPHGLGDLSTTFHLPNMSGYWVNGHSSTYPQGFSNSAPTHSHSVSSLTLASHTHSVPALTIPSQTVASHSHTFTPGTAYMQYTTPASAGVSWYRQVSASSWTDDHALQSDASAGPDTTGAGNSRTSAIGIDGATDSNPATTASNSTGTGTAGQPSTNAIGGTLDNSSANTLPPHLGVKYMIKT